MAEWVLHGTDMYIDFDRNLSPNYLEENLRFYRKTLGEEFGLDDLLKVMDIRAKMHIAEMLADLPEYTVHHFAKAAKEAGYSTALEPLDNIADSLNEISNRLGTR